MGKKIPNGWLDYSSTGSPIASSPFVAFKTPLKKELCKLLPPEALFVPPGVMEQFPQLGLVIDLTDTDRYYSREEFTKEGVSHEKIRCPGKVLPPEELVQRFFGVVDSFVKKNEAGKRKLIGVHCTHGLNRTGYFVCRYLIQRMGLTPSDAIQGFEAARGHKMERPLYIDYLRACKPQQPPPPRPPESDIFRMGDRNQQRPPAKRKEQRNRSRSPLWQSQADSVKPQPSRNNRQRRSSRPHFKDGRRNEERRSIWDNSFSIPPETFPGGGYPRRPFFDAPNPVSYQFPNYYQVDWNNHPGGSPLDNLYGEPPYPGHRTRFYYNSGSVPPQPYSRDTGERSPQRSAYTWRRNPH